MILVFDMDDTLYDEWTYALSGLSHVAARLEMLCGIPQAESYALMTARLQQSRSGVIDGALKDLGLYTQTRAADCVRWYRGHRPSIARHPDVTPCFKRFKNWTKYLVTDGVHTAQAQKVKALHLHRVMKACYLTGNYPKGFQKPSPYCFLKIAQREGVFPDQVVYIADNPHKDFVGIRPLGFRTIRVMRGPYRDVEAQPGYDADIQIPSLEVLSPAQVQAWFGDPHHG